MMFRNKIDKYILITILALALVVVILSVDERRKAEVAFFKPIITEFPDSTIFKFYMSGNKYFVLNLDKFENGSHIVGGSWTIYSSSGNVAEHCAIYGEQPPLCKKAQRGYKELVYASPHSFFSRGNEFDPYDLR
jgi:hypothetical protein